MAKKKAYTTGEIADFCGVNFRTVIRWIERGLLKAYQLPGRGDNRVKIDDFIRFLHTQNIPVPDEFREISRRVLIIEDERSVAKSIERILQKSGFETQVAYDGFSAGSLIESFAPAVITLDLLMPGVSGLEVLKYIRSTPSIAATKVLVVSILEKKKLDEALKAGADGALQKPFNNKELVEKVKKLAGIREIE